MIAYILILAPMLAALARGHAPARTRWLSPLWALAVTLLAGIALSILTAPLAPHAGLQLALTLPLCVLIGYAAGALLAGWRPSDAPMKLRRGAVVTAASPGGGAGGGGLTLAGVPIPRADETKHFKLIGTTGTGKSTAIRELLAAALHRGDAAIIADPDGGYLARFYDAARGDVILNPFDGDARRWDLFSEITHEYDVEQLARSLIPDQGTDPTWSAYARTLFSAVAQQLIADGNRDDGELYQMLTCAPRTELRALLEATAAGPFLEAGNEKMFGSVRSVMTSALTALQYTTRQQAEPFSVRKWVRPAASAANVPAVSLAPRGVLFLPYRAGEIAALRSVISAWLRLAIFEAMDGDEGDRPLWFVIDELDALGQIDGLKDALARLRKFGGRCVLGLQSIAQASATYGRGTAETIVENCGNTLILRCSASEHGGTAEFASRLIGQREIIYTQRSSTRVPGKWRPSVTASEQLRSEPAVLASQIERLPDLAGFLKLASVPDWQSVTLTPSQEPTRPRVRRPSILAPARASSPTSPTSPSSPNSPTASPAAAPKPSRRAASSTRASVRK
ncbi:MAG: type IV secretion system DNA-binding domain-containing protein [Steroidobacteraceae bacterium]